MKRIWTLMLTLALLLAGASAETADDSLKNFVLPCDTPVQLDLDGDGTLEAVSWSRVMPNEYDEQVRLQIGDAEWVNDYTLYCASVYVVDLDSDGKTELFVSGDEMSDDYVTYCLRYENGAISPLSFANVARGSDCEGYNAYGYGQVTAIGENTLALTGSQDTLGTYMATRTFALRDGTFELEDDGLWHVQRDLAADGAWEYGCLTLKQKLPVIFTEDGEAAEGEPGELAAGETLAITAFDRISLVCFVTPDGRTGYFHTVHDEEAGWGLIINGVSESELFELIPYAD